MAKLKNLYAIQGTGNGHLSRAIDIIPCLKMHGDVDLLVSGCQGDLPLPYDVKFVVNGLSFIFGKKGGVDLYKTVMRSHPRILLREIKNLPVEDYDLVINDFEPVSAWPCHFKKTPCILKSYSFTTEKPVDTISFYVNDAIWINNMIKNKPGVLSAAGRTDYRFIFPTMNRYSNSGYDGPVDAIIKNVSGQILGVAENITKDGFGNYIEFAFAPPPILSVQLVKHGTTESYLAGQQVNIQMVMQNNKSKLILLNEKANDSGTFTGVEANINLADYFDF